MHAVARTSRALTACLLALPLAAAALAAPAPARAAESDPGLAGTGPIVLHERVPLSFLLSTPTGETGNTSSSDLIRIVSALTDKHTNFFLQVTDPQVATDCRGRLGCLVQQLRAPIPKFLLVISNVTLSGEADRLSAVLIDPHAALDYARSAEDADTERDAEARINEYAVLLGPERAQVKNAAESEAFLENLFLNRLSKIFKESENWEPYGTLELSGTEPGVAITLDGAAIGATRPEKTVIEKVTAGIRRLSLEKPGLEPYLTEVSVARGQTVSLQISLKKGRTSAAPVFRSILFWTGAAAATAGVAVSALAIAQHDGDLGPICIHTPGTACRDRASFETFSYNPNVMRGGQLNPGGVLAAPLGFSLIAAGAAWTLATLFIGEENDAPWLQLGLGLAAGALSYGLSAALGAP